MPITAEKRKEYNSKYYASKKIEIAKKLYAKEDCEYCGRSVSHQNMNNHLKTRLCQERREPSLVDKLQEKIEKLETRINLMNDD